MKLNQIYEALKPSQYRAHRAAWDPRTYGRLFDRYKHDEKKYRIYLPLVADHHIVDSDVLHAVDTAVKDQGYHITDYVGGYAKSDDGARTKKIGKIITDPVIMQKFSNDPARANSNKNTADMLVCISRHPYDIAGMSTDRGWTSCMDMVDGDNIDYIMSDVEGGTLIAYLINADDKNITSPIARLLIKPFILNSKDASPDDYILVAEQRVYGTNAPGFKETVAVWLKEVNHGKDDGVYCIKPGIYADSAREVLHAPNKSKTEILDIISADPKKYKMPPFKYIVTQNGSINLEVTGVYGALLRILTQYEIKINKLKGDFDCSTLTLTQLPICTPKYITGDFDCSDNSKLKSLKNAPSMVSGTVNTSGTELDPVKVRDTIIAKHYEHNF
jgi:hypothetical protein